MLNRREVCTILGSAFIGLPFSGEAAHAKEITQLKYHVPEGSILRIDNWKRFTIDELDGIIVRFCGNDGYYKYDWITQHLKNVSYYDKVNDLTIDTVSNLLFLGNFINHFSTHKVTKDVLAYGYINRYNHNCEKLLNTGNARITPNYYDFGEQVLVSP